MSFTAILPFIQVILSVLLVGAILLQQSEGSLGSAFGSSGGANSFHVKRGPEKFLFIGTIVLGILFILSTVVALFVR